MQKQGELFIQSIPLLKMYSLLYPPEASGGYFWFSICYTAAATHRDFRPPRAFL